MFSGRTPRSLEPNHLTQTLARLRERGMEWVDLTLSNPTAVGLPYPAKEILDALRDPRALTYQPTPLGHEDTRRAIASYYRERGCAVDPAHIVLSASTSEAYTWLFKLLCEPGDEVLAPSPSYPLFECLAALEGVRMVQYPLLEENGWGIDFEALERLASPRCRAVIFVSPNNPTGAYLNPDARARLQEFARQRSLALVVDEVFLDSFYGDALPEAASAAGIEAAALTFTLSGLSKVAGLPQMKLGWTVVGGPEPLRREALERLEWISDSYLSVSAPVQCATPKWLALAPALQKSIAARCRFNRELLEQALTPETGCRLLPAEAGWVAVVDVPRVYSEEAWVLSLVAKHQVLVQPGFFYDFPREALLVVSLLPAEPVFAEGAERLIQGLRSI